MTKRAIAVILTVVALLSASVGTADAAPHHHHHHTMRWKKINHARHIVIEQAGDPYVYGAAGPSSFDCSGLFYYSYRRAGLSMPRTSQQQYNRTRHISRSNTVRGDLLFFHDSGGSVYHVAMMAGRVNGHIIMWHAPHTGTVVHRARPWTGAYYSGTLRLKH